MRNIIKSETLTLVTLRQCRQGRYIIGERERRSKGEAYVR